jgi:hypothetical protein
MSLRNFKTEGLDSETIYIQKPLKRNRKSTHGNKKKHKRNKKTEWIYGISLKINPLDKPPKQQEKTETKRNNRYKNSAY